MTILLRVQGGFCNRLRSIVCAVLWAEDLGCKLEIFWPVEMGHMPCRMEELLDISTIPLLTQSHLGYLKGAKQVLSSDDMENAIKTYLDDIRIQSYSVFHSEFWGSRGLSVLKGILVLPSLVEEAERISSGFLTMTGLHIRRTDHVKCIAASPLEKFMSYVKENPDTYFLATDELAVKETFKEILGDALVSPVKILGRMQKKEQEQGIVDWLLLQKCSRILASAGSSFSELAAFRAGKELVVIKLDGSLQ